MTAATGDQRSASVKLEELERFLDEYLEGAIVVWQRSEGEGRRRVRTEAVTRHHRPRSRSSMVSMRDISSLKKMATSRTARCWPRHMWPP